ncbi:cyclic nucleotide-binding domain-containing protein [Longivirga aurantiaca]|uniref:Cyclic nucleotide-binding domain-containing protein n=1 Tax=Longivirga aurantiaca TaxID=1837743 RepID=A0ABW1T0L4_9ACTN
MSRTPWKPVGLVLLSSASLQMGLAVAASVFAAAGPVSAVWVRSLVGAVLLWAYIRPDISAYTRDRLGPIAVYGASLACLTLCAYVAIAHAPLGYVSAILMLGPLAIAAWGNRTPVDLALVGVAAIGALLLCLANGTDGPVSLTGLGFALAGAVALAAYIVAGKRVNAAGSGLSGLALALVITAALQTPFGLLLAEPGLWDVHVLLTLALAGVLATLVPFSLEAVALRTLPMATFGLVLAFEPAVAALTGIVIRDDVLVAQQWLGIGLIVVAAAGSLGPRDWMRRMGSDNARLMTDATVAALGRVPLFAGLSAPELATLAGAAQTREFAAGDVLTHEGDDGDEFFVLSTGTVDISAHGQHLRTLGEGDFLGEIALLFGGTRTATATAASPGTLYSLPKPAFLALLEEHPDIEDKILGTVSERMRYR